MIQQITNGISVSVETFYQPDHSNAINSEYLFAYRITIDNFSNYPVKLLSRKWHIVESNGIKRIVEGEGVVGEQPVIPPGGNYQYVSAANLRSDIGKMYGNYEMLDLHSKKTLTVNIPEFRLIAPFKMN
jgi:ApaG protein